MGDRLVGWYRVTINGVAYENGMQFDTEEHPAMLEIEHRDNEATRLTLSVFDCLNGGSPPYPEFNRHPNPRKVSNIVVEAVGGWEGEQLYPLFAGYLVAKCFDEEIPSYTKFVALHEAGKLSKHERVDTFGPMSGLAMLKKKAGEYGCTIELDKSAAGDPALTEVLNIWYQEGKTNWQMMMDFLREHGFITTYKKRNIIVIARDKTAGQQLVVKYGGDIVKRADGRQERKQGRRGSKGRGHHHESIAGKHAHYPREVLLPDDDGRGVHWEGVPLPKTRDSVKHPQAKKAVEGKKKRRKIEGDEFSCSVSLEPWMINHENISVVSYGAQIDGSYQTRMVRHVLGNEWTTYIEAVRP